MSGRLIRQLWRFLVVGALNTVTDLAVLNVETLLSGVTDGVGYAVQKGISFACAVVLSYLLNRRWTFEVSSRQERGRQFWRFVAVSLLGASINVLTATVVVTYVKPVVNPVLDLAALTDQLWVSIGALCGSAAGFSWNFLGYKFVVFHHADRR